MSYEIINSIPQFNFQINRILTYGNLACCREEVISHVAQVKTFEEWHTAWPVSNTHLRAHETLT